ncbi:hypothetical protein QFC20_000612 [Naganishia adeliensis]|uniref:Uncharacterized protein n=1 Tax=Naganishia adeliensis TaxID=92952 RepID=A0ACC2WY24_9TREE|nr:hypothetical protein QFC20_000612 [Naganishia adeliensis]
MGDAALRGTNTTQDVRFKNKEKMAMKATKFPKEFTEKVDIRKVNLAIMRPWVTTTVTELAGIEDDIVIEFVMQLLESKEDPALDPRKMQIQLGGFLTPENAAEFMLRLWKLLLSAQASHGGIPAEFVEAKKQELMKRQEEEAKMQQKMMEAGGRRDQGRPPSRFDRDNRDRQPVPRDRDGRAFPQDRDYGQQRGYQGGGGGDRGAMRDTYIPSDMRRNDGRGGGGRGRDGGYQSRPRDGGYPDRRQLVQRHRPEAGLQPSPGTLLRGQRQESCQREGKIYITIEIQVQIAYASATP